MFSSTQLSFAVVLASILIGLTASSVISADLLSGAEKDFETVNGEFEIQVSPTGAELENASHYRFAEYENSLLFGPYILEDERYYYHRDKVLNSNLRPVSKTEVEGLHAFYIKTYLDPLFYSPTKSQEFNLTKFERFEQDKILSKYCGLEYDLIPGDYFEDLEENHEATQRFLINASRKNAENVISQNTEATSSYSKYINQFINLINRDVSNNRCFDNKSENYGLAKATRTPTQYRIDSKTLLSYSDTANNNAEQLLKDIQKREKILNSKTDFTIKTGNNLGKQLSFNSDNSLENYSYSYKEVLGPQEAKDEMNNRRIGEVTGLESSEDENETEDEPENDSEEDHTHGQDTHTHEGKDEEDEDENSELKGEQWEEVRLVEDIPTQYDVKPSCMEREMVPVYGWDKNIYPNLILGQDILFKNKPEYLRDFFTLSRCPYVELTKIKWHTTDGLYRDIKENPVNKDYNGPKSKKIEKAEEIFLGNPGEESLSQLSDSYELGLKTSLKSNSFDNNLPVLWGRSLQERSKLHKFETTYDDFYNEEHMDVWDKYFPTPGPDDRPDVYNNFLLLESVYALTFMTWSDSVWRLEQKPEKFSGKLE